MAFCSWKIVILLQRVPIPNLTLVRHGHQIKGKAPGVARSLKQRLADESTVDPSLHFKVDIGLAQPKRSRTKELQARIKYLRQTRSDLNMEKIARMGQLQIPLEKMKEDWWETSGPHQLHQVAEHYGVFEHLFGDAYFTPRVSLNVAFPQKDGVMAPVYHGNIVKPREAKTPPEVSFLSKPDSLWTLALTNPDGHFTQKGAEYVHWLVGNIPGSELSKGEVLMDYLQPFPPRGTGFHRFIFILYQQTKHLDYTAISKPTPCLKLSERTFSTLEFYRERQDVLTPAGLAFFQTDWDDSLTNFFHNSLEMKEPVYEYDFPPPYIRPQEWFPIRKPFNLYMDKYRDPKKIAEEYLLRKLKNVSPFRRTRPPPRFPNAEPIPPNVPSWLALKMRKDRLGWGRINDV